MNYGLKNTLLCTAFLLVLAACGGPGDKYADLAQCLTDKGVVEYGTFWCPNCAKQKKDFGDGYENIKYIECDPRGENAQPDLCIQKNVERYPTWEFADGSQLIGRQELQVLADKAECPMPTDEE